MRLTKVCWRRGSIEIAALLDNQTRRIINEPAIHYSGMAVHIWEWCRADIGKCFALRIIIKETRPELA
jgi:hypothetical protein